MGLSLIVRVRSLLGVSFVSSPTVESTRKDRNDRENVLAELGLSGLVHCRVENHDLCTVLCEESGEELEREAGKSVSMGNHNFLEISSFREVHQGFKSLSLVVESRPNVADDSIFGTFNSTVAHFLFRGWRDVLARRSEGQLRCPDSGPCGPLTVDSSSTWSGCVCEPSFVAPSIDCWFGDTVFSLDIQRIHVGGWMDPL